jgi:uncharacterized protein YndB with AHSA1/START domain
MWQREKSASIKASPETIWQLWADSAGRKYWDTSVEWIKLDGPIAAGATGKMKPLGIPAAPFAITEATPNRSLSENCHFPYADLDLIHHLQPEADGTVTVTHRLQIHGPLGFILVKLFGKRLSQTLEHSLRKLGALAEARAGLKTTR